MNFWCWGCIFDCHINHLANITAETDSPDRIQKSNHSESHNTLHLVIRPGYSNSLHSTWFSKDEKKFLKCQYCDFSAVGSNSVVFYGHHLVVSLERWLGAEIQFVDGVVLVSKICSSLVICFLVGSDIRKTALWFMKPSASFYLSNYFNIPVVALPAGSALESSRWERVNSTCLFASILSTCSSRRRGPTARKESCISTKDRFAGRTNSYFRPSLWSIPFSSNIFNGTSANQKKKPDFLVPFPAFFTL